MIDRQMDGAEGSFGGKGNVMALIVMMVSGYILIPDSSRCVY